MVPAGFKPAVFGGIGGAAAAMIVGFGFGGWVSGGTAEREADLRVQTAVVSMLAPICADRFLQQADVAGSLAEFYTANSWGRDTVVARSGFAIMPGSTDTANGVIRACAEILAKTKN